MKWGEFASLLAGLSADSPLGRIVQIRCENDPKILEKFTPQQHKIRNDWREKTAKQVSAESFDSFLEAMKNTFIKMAGGEVSAG